jgi:hypothetical protein
MDGTCFANSNSPASKYSTAKSHAIKYSKENARHKQNDHFVQPGMAKKSHTKKRSTNNQKDGTRKYVKMAAADSKSINREPKPVVNHTARKHLTRYQTASPG